MVYTHIYAIENCVVIISRYTAKLFCNAWYVTNIYSTVYEKMPRFIYIHMWVESSWMMATRWLIVHSRRLLYMRMCRYSQRKTSDLWTLRYVLTNGSSWFIDPLYSAVVTLTRIFCFLLRRFLSESVRVEILTQTQRESL
jgi:hypothetical protein